MADQAMAEAGAADVEAPHPEFDWRRIAYLTHVSRAMDKLEEERLVPERKVLYQFSARGHDMAQVMLGTRLTHAKDAIGGYYRSRPILLTLDVPLEDALGSGMGREGGYSDGRDIGVVFNYPNLNGAPAIPMSGGVGAQYTPTAGWAQAIEYHRNVLGNSAYVGAISVVLGGDASCATGGFWASLVIATTQKLPMLFYVEDNQFGISVPATFQTPGGDISKNLASFTGLTIFSGDGTDPAEAARLIDQAVAHVRGRNGPALLHLRVPRLQGHSFQDTQTYKGEDLVRDEWARDPLPRLKSFLLGSAMSEEEWDGIEAKAQAAVEEARAAAEARGISDPESVLQHVYYEGEMQKVGGQWTQGYRAPRSHEEPKPEGQRINMVTAIRRTLDHELEINPRVLLFGEDIGPKGGVHAVTLGLQEKYGAGRVFDTSLNEEGIVGRAVGMALAGLMPVPEIQFRKYAEPATEQINDCGTMRWRTANRFAAPMVLRIPGGFFKCGDPWHSQTNEVQFVHNPGWLVAVPSNAEDAVGLLRSGRQRSCDLLRAPRDAGRCLGPAALSWRRLCPPLRPREEGAAGRRPHHRHLGRDGAALRGSGGRILRRCDRPAHARPLGPRDGARQHPPHPPLRHRPRGFEDRRLRRGDRRGRCRRSLPRSRRARRSRHDAGHSQPP
jgi:2-oxoisovalerate dehydrogenase E1 component